MEQTNNIIGQAKAGASAYPFPDGAPSRRLLGSGDAMDKGNVIELRPADSVGQQSGATENQPSTVNRPMNMQVNHIMRPFVNSALMMAQRKPELHELFHQSVLDDVKDRLNMYRHSITRNPSVDDLIKEVLAERSEKVGYILPNPYITALVPVRKPHSVSR